MLRLGDYLPSIYGDLVPRIANLEIPEETRATCDDCVMCARGDYPKELELKSFHPDVKCCSYHPSLPNYLVGAILASTDSGMEEGRRRIGEKIRAGVAITPRGILVPRKYTLFYENAQSFFGRSEAMRCPYYHGGGCSIWRYRDSVCATYFCRYSRGEMGKRFWEELKRYLSLIETKLALHCAASLVADPAQLGRLWDSWDFKGPVTVEDMEERAPSEKDRRELWGDWLGREEAFYLGCFDAASKVDQKALDALVGVEEQFLREKLISATGPAVSPHVPERLRRNPELCAVKKGDGYFCTNPRVPGDAFELSALVFPLLDAFDGQRGNEEVCREIAVTHKISLPPEVIKTFYHLGVLLESPVP